MRRSAGPMSAPCATRGGSEAGSDRRHKEGGATAVSPPCSPLKPGSLCSGCRCKMAEGAGRRKLLRQAFRCILVHVRAPGISDGDRARRSSRLKTDRRSRCLFGASLLTGARLAASGVSRFRPGAAWPRKPLKAFGRTSGQGATFIRTVLYLADDSSSTDVGARYAQALFDLSVETGCLDAVEADLKSLKAMRADSRDLADLMVSPRFTTEDKAKGLKAAGRKGWVPPDDPEVPGSARAERPRRGPARHHLRVRAAIRQAPRRGLGPGHHRRSRSPRPKPKAWSQSPAVLALGKDPQIETKVDPAILGGLKVRVGSRLYDASLKSKLDSLKFALKRA